MHVVIADTHRKYWTMLPALWQVICIALYCYDVWNFLYKVPIKLLSRLHTSETCNDHLRVGEIHSICSKVLVTTDTHSKVACLMMIGVVGRVMLLNSSLMI